MELLEDGDEGLVTYDLGISCLSGVTVLLSGSEKEQNLYHKTLSF